MLAPFPPPHPSLDKGNEAERDDAPCLELQHPNSMPR